MTIHQAFFGDSNGSHNLLATTLDNRNLIGKLKSITDNPASINVDYAYVSGYLIEDNYVFCRTMSDLTSERGGMVFSHCLIVSKSKLNELNNLAPIFANFVKETIKDFDSLNAININTNLPFSTQKPTIYDTAVHHLVSNKKTVVYLGYKEFEAFVEYLWYYLPVVLRENFSFTISGTPNEIRDENYTLIHTPDNYQSKWGGFSMIKDNEKVDNSSLAHVFLSERNNNERMTFQQFITTNDILLSHPYQLSEITKCFNLVNQTHLKADLSTLKRLILLLTKLLPDINKGKELKGFVFKEFIRLLKKTDHLGIKMIWNLSFDAFENGQTQIESAVNQWAYDFIKPNSELGISKIGDLLTDVYAIEGSNWWNKLFTNRINELCQNINKESALFIWNIWQTKRELIEHFKTIVAAKSETILLTTMPCPDDKSWFKTISSFALFKQWYSLYASSIIQYETVDNAMNLQVKHDKSLNLQKNLTLIAHNQEKAFVLAAVQVNNVTLHQVAGKLCADKIEILLVLNVSNIHWQSIWYNTYLETNDIGKGITDIKTVFYQLLDLLSENASVKENLLVAIINNTGNIFDYPKRADIWGKLPSTPKQLILEKTAFNVFENYERIEWSDLENDLIQVMKKQAFINKLLSSRDYEVKYKMVFLDKLSLFNESYAITIVKTGMNQIGYSEREYLSKLIKDNKWDDLLEILYDNRHSSNKNVSHIVYECKNRLGFFQRAFLNKPKSYTLQELINLIDIDVSKIFILFDSTDSEYLKLKREFVAGNSEGIKLEELCNRLKVYLHSLDKKHN